jgi:hypothetical protein
MRAGRIFCIEFYKGAVYIARFVCDGHSMMLRMCGKGDVSALACIDTTVVVFLCGSIVLKGDGVSAAFFLVFFAGWKDVKRKEGYRYYEQLFHLNFDLKGKANIE